MEDGENNQQFQDEEVVVLSEKAKSVGHYSQH